MDHLRGVLWTFLVILTLPSFAGGTSMVDARLAAPVVTASTHDTLLASLMPQASDPLGVVRALGQWQSGLHGAPVVEARPATERPLVFLARALLVREHVVPTPATDVALERLATIPLSTSRPIAATFAAFLDFDAAARAHAAAPGPVTFASFVAARATLVAAGLALRDAPVAREAGNEIIVAPAFSLDLNGGASHYVDDVALAIDLGGDDRYDTNAGGTGDRSLFGPTCHDVLVGDVGTPGFPAAALFDVGGDDTYGAGRSCGVNGGGFHGAGFLLDAAGDDRYVTGLGAVNGGALLAGEGFLIDLAGSDSYEAQVLHSDYAYGANGAAAGFGLSWSDAALLDLGTGDDFYSCGQEGCNGGGYAFGTGFLYDEGGDDAYFGTTIAVNGGATEGVGVLVDRGGDDRYTATDTGVNGGGLLGWGLLVDAAGHDRYETDDLDGHTGWDLTVVPRELAGAQVDLA